MFNVCLVDSVDYPYISYRFFKFIGHVVISFRVCTLHCAALYV